MTLKYSTTIRDARLNAIVSAIGPSPVLRFFASPEMPLTRDADPAGCLAEIQLPATWLALARNASITKDGTWSGRASEVGRIKSFRLYDSRGTCHLQGSVAEEAGADMIISNCSVVPGQKIVIDEFCIVASNGATVMDRRDVPATKVREPIINDGQSLKFKKALEENRNATR